MQPQPKTLAAAAREALLTQARELERFWHTPALRLPMLCVWTASFGGALHYPCTTYFYLLLGATKRDIGNFGLVVYWPDVVLAPVYGHVVDARGAYRPLGTRDRPRARAAPTRRSSPRPAPARSGASSAASRPSAASAGCTRAT